MLGIVVPGFGSFASSTDDTLQVENGILDLRDWDFSSTRTLYLGGDWSYVPNLLLTPSEFEKHSGIQTTQVPNDWSRIDNPPTPTRGRGTGTATYGVKILLPKSVRSVGLQLGSLYYSSRVYADGQLVSQNGKPGMSRKDSIASAWSTSGTRAIYPKEATPGEINLIVQIANFTHSNGGFRVAMEIGNPEVIVKKLALDELMRMVLVGGALVLAVYHGILYLNRRKDLAFLAFSGFLLAIVIHGACSLNLVRFAFPDVPANIALRMEYLSMIVGTFSGAQFVWLLYPKTKVKIADLMLKGWVVFFTTLYLTADTLLVSAWLPQMQLGILVTLVVGIYSITCAVYQREEGARLFLFSLLIVAFGVTTGVVSHFLIGYTPSTIVYTSMSAMILAQATVLGRRVTGAITTSERLTERLARTNERLEAQVAERTSDLQHAVEETELALLEAHRANRVKSDFLAMMSHEIRTPLNGVLGMASLLKQSDLTNRQLSQIDIIHQSGDDLLLILNDILDISKIEAGELSLEERMFDLEDLLVRCAKLWEPRAAEKGVALKWSSKLPGEFGLLGDEHRILQVLSNLTSNAVKFTDQGCVCIDIALASQSDDEVTIRVTVADTGIGIEQDAMETLFAPFQQADLSTTRKYGGTGLGLAICKRLAEAMGGTIEAYKNETAGRGTVFALELPLKRCEVPALVKKVALKVG